MFSVSTIKLNILFLLLIIGVFESYSQADLTAGESIYEDENRIGTEIIKEGKLELERPMLNNDRSLMAGTILYDQSELVNYPAQGFGGANASGTTGELFGLNAFIGGNFFVADDFTVPISELWSIDSIVVFCYETGSGTTSSIDSVIMQVRQGNTPGTGSVVFGDMTTNRLANTYFSGIYRARPANLTNNQRPIMKARVNLNGTSFTSGSYMIEYILGGNSMLAGPFALLRTLGTTHIATGNAFQYNASWINVFEKDVLLDNPLPKGLTFIVYGTSVEDNAARINGVNYYTLQDAINAAVNDGDEITLLKNINDATINVGLNNKSVVIKSDGYTCTINQLNISNGEYLKWIEGTLGITGVINNNTSGILWNNAIIANAIFNNTGIYKGNGSFNGNLNNQNHIVPGN